MLKELIEMAKEATMKKTGEEAVKTLLAEHIKRRIDQCREEVRRYELKYGVSFSQYEKLLGEKIPLTYEHEKDYMRWGALLDEIEELEKMQRKLEWM